MITNIDRSVIEAALRDPATDWQQVITLSGWAAKGLQDWAREVAPDLLPMIAAKKATDLPVIRRQAMEALLPLANRAADVANLDPRSPMVVNAQSIIAAAMKVTGKMKLRPGTLQALAQVMAERGCMPPTPASMRCHRLEICKDPVKFGITEHETTVPVA